MKKGTCQHRILPVLCGVPEQALNVMVHRLREVANVCECACASLVWDGNVFAPFQPK